MKEKFTPIENDILEKLVSISLTSTELSCALILLRKTNGYNKIEDGISISQFMQYTGKSRPTICSALKQLQLVKIIILVKSGKSMKSYNRYRFNKNIKEWKLVKKIKLVKNTKSTSKENQTQLVKKTIHTKDNIQKTIYKRNIPKGMDTPTYGNKDLISLKKFLINNYPKPLVGITDTRKLQNIRQVSTRRKNQDEWMEDNWKENIKNFLSLYIERTPEEYLVNSIDKLRERIKLWREYRGKLN